MNHVLLQYDCYPWDTECSWNDHILYSFADGIFLLKFLHIETIKETNN